MRGADDRWTEPDWESTSGWCRARNRHGIRCIIDVLGEYSRSEAEIRQSSREYLESIDLIAEEKLNASVTIKLTTLGALFDREKCMELALEISRKAASKNIDFEIDMEGRELVGFTLDTAIACVKGNGRTTLALQAYLDRTPADLRASLEKGIRPRLVKGAYKGDVDDFAEIQARFMKLFETASGYRSPVLVGTHDPDLVQRIKQRAERERVEFGFLKGLADRTKLEMTSQGWAVSEYVPFGKKRDAYELRRQNYLSQLNALGRTPLP